MPTPDILDSRIRALVTELIESTPQAPPLPQLEWGDLHQSPIGPHPRHGWPTQRPPRRPGTLRVLLSTVVVLAALAGIVTLVAVGPRSRPPALGRAHDPRPADQAPVAVSGNEETIQALTVPAFFNQAQSSSANCWVGVGSVQAFHVEGSPTFVSWTMTRDAATSCPSLQTTAITYEGNGLGNGTGIDSTMDPATESLAGTPTSVFVIEQWPVSGKTVYVWSGLPSTAAYVAYSYRGSTLYWEEPMRGVAAFLVPQLFPEGTHYGIWHTSPFPVLSAYDSTGNLLGSVNAPRINGDDFGMSPTGAG